jgi:hypothetical protein
MAASLTAPITFVTDSTAVPNRRRAAGFLWATLALEVKQDRRRIEYAGLFAARSFR